MINFKETYENHYSSLLNNKKNNGIEINFKKDNKFIEFSSKYNSRTYTEGVVCYQDRQNVKLEESEWEL
ncbi:hypothetical protein [Inconstantimicrobium mannanitabidum]|uniref:Uncharacterized protein n=1 Tax=Inconstantimicrobium mannanitabidum TaxID=1604901 RepID=A0ACB5RAI3_9CLOT|nr:hypothetical protein [Clostridium sp. TW13]GKX66202.1 hypothetical protein rsdtw13_14600 [Clostridium sp. TW13]